MISVGCVLIHGVTTAIEQGDISLVIDSMLRGKLITELMMPGRLW